MGCDRVFSGVVRCVVFFTFFSTGCADRIARSKKLGSKRYFFECVRMHDLVFNRKSPFSIHRSDCIGIGLTYCKVLSQWTANPTAQELALEEPSFSIFFVLVGLFFVCTSMLSSSICCKQAQHRTAQSTLHKAAKQVRADQSATTQASRQS